MLESLINCSKYSVDRVWLRKRKTIQIETLKLEIYLDLYQLLILILPSKYPSVLDRVCHFARMLFIKHLFLHFLCFNCDCNSSWSFS